MIYINAYSVTQHYGGPEEGGWYYYSDEPIASLPHHVKEWKVSRNEEFWEGVNTTRDLLKYISDADVDEINNKVKIVTESVESFQYGQLGSVLGGNEIKVLLRDSYGDSSPKEKPFYE
jgi:hypothetical protein